MTADTGICTQPPRIVSDAESLAVVAAERWFDLYREATDARGAFQVALAGGSTPKRLYQLLAMPDRQGAIDWARVHLYFGDERAVPPEHADSNYRMVREALLDHVPVPPDNVRRMRATPERIEQDAANYAAVLREHLPHTAAGTPIFDLVLLGMGADGHTCSLFPGTPILAERTRTVAPVHVEQLDSWRLSLTYPVLDAARHLLFLVAGSDKAARLRHVCRGETPLVPVQHIRPRGTVEWYVDRAAAELDPWRR